MYSGGNLEARKDSNLSDNVDIHMVMDSNVSANVDMRAVRDSKVSVNMDMHAHSKGLKFEYQCGYACSKGLKFEYQCGYACSKGLKFESIVLLLLSLYSSLTMRIINHKCILRLTFTSSKRYLKIHIFPLHSTGKNVIS